MNEQTALSETVTISEPFDKQKKVKTIDELLENTSDMAIDIDNDNEIKIPEKKMELEDLVEGDTKKDQDTKEIRLPEVEDTLENDLFDLIDSMYSNKEDGE